MVLAAWRPLAVLATPALAKAAGDDGDPEAGARSGRAAGPQPGAGHPLRRPAGAVARVRARFPWLSPAPGAARLPPAAEPDAGQSEPGAARAAADPQDVHDFSYTGVVPNPWLQLNFVYGNSTVSATVVLAGTTAIDAAGYYDPTQQMGVNDAYMTVNLTRKLGFPLQVNVGAYTGRYGAMGMYDMGRYGTPLIAQTNSIGEQIPAAYNVGDLTLAGGSGPGRSARAAAGRRSFPAGLEQLRRSQRRRDLHQPVPRRRRLQARASASGCTT